MRCRALIDNGSQSCLMTELLAQHLKLPKRTEPDLKIARIDQSEIKIDGTTEAKIKSHVSNYQIALQFLIVSKITGDLPSTSINMSKFNIQNNIILSDPSFHSR